MWDVGDGMGWWMVFGSFWMVFLWVLVIWVLIRVFGSGDTGSRQERESPLDIAKRRYARGEISRDEFNEIRRELGE